jgi:hypothetical protein
MSQKNSKQQELKADEKSTELDVLFPYKEIDIGNGATVQIKPLNLETLPKVVDAFGAIMSLSEQGLPPAEIAMRGMKELLILLPLCINKAPEEIPSAAIPEIIEIVLEQNLTDAAVGKWTALIQRVMGYVGEIPVEAGKSQSQKAASPK